MKKYFKIIALFLITFTGCNEAQEVEKSILESSFKECFFEEGGTYLKFEKALIINGFIVNNSAQEYHRFFSEYYPYNEYKTEKEIKKKYKLATIINQYFKNLDNLESCSSILKKEDMSSKLPSQVLQLLKVRNEIDEIIISGEVPKEWDGYSNFSEAWKENLKKDWFTNLDVKYMSIVFIYRELNVYSIDKMKKDIASSKIIFGEREVIEKKDEQEKKNDNDLEIIVVEDDESVEGEIAETAIEEEVEYDEVIGATVKSNEFSNEETKTKEDSKKYESYEHEPNEYVRYNNLNWTKVPKKIWKEKYITSLDLYNNKLRTISNDIGKLINLDYLELKDNELISLPSKAFKKLKKLEVLRVNNNKLTEVPKEIGDLSVLTHLIIENNKLCKIPESIGKLKKIEVLDFTNNKLTSLPDTIGDLESLEYLLLSDNNLKKLPRSIRSLDKLKVLSIKNNPLSDKEKENIIRLLPVNCKIYFN
ncbi:leucine-rich repeat domain-containing protein [Tenacibaculum sp. M341]|uniref:leucine-rich repeat domain-containing protein n=1 Tax=Tenacibaculum sp. M341 TaxID=2530339 RepID=UPI00104F2B47|nr:leucine-rich repeat domain-containing protein [Tenacibaculum sp. M341]TCI94803.1 leucine-rich repeat domain-containing protein [Tenacibaculum sp. M341]